MKRSLLVLVAIVSLGFSLTAKEPDGKSLQLVEATIDDIQKALDKKLISTQQLVQMYLYRIGAYDQVGPHLNAYIHLNPNALAEARQIDQEDHKDKGKEKDKQRFGNPVGVGF